MNAKAAKLTRRYAALYPPRLRRSVVKSIKKRWGEASPALRSEMRQDMEKALARPDAAGDAILRKLRDMVADDKIE